MTARLLPLLLLLSPASVAAAGTSYVVARDYQYGGGSAGDYPDWRAITWVWRSAAEREACRGSVFADPRARRSDPLGTPVCEHARLAPVRHRSAVDVLPSDPACGALTTVTFMPAGQDRLTRLTGCIGPEQLGASTSPLRPGAWIFVVDVREIAEETAPNLHRIGSYRTWTDCEHIRRTVRDDLSKESGTEAGDGAKLAATGACLPEELLE
jgi:hypothetical protein